MKAELRAWNHGEGIDLDTWIGCKGNFRLAVGYSTLFCPTFIEFEDYVFVGEEMCDQSIATLRGFERSKDSTPMSVEWVLNHIHILDLHYRGCPDATADKLIFLGEALKQSYEARLQYFLPDKPCVVEFYKPEDPNELDEYQLSFWQKKHDPSFAKGKSQ